MIIILLQLVQTELIDIQRKLIRVNQHSSAPQTGGNKRWSLADSTSGV